MPVRKLWPILKYDQSAKKTEYNQGIVVRIVNLTNGLAEIQMIACQKSFPDFHWGLPASVQVKVEWTLKLIHANGQGPENYFKP